MTSEALATIDVEVHRLRGQTLRLATAPPPTPARRPAYVAELLALAHQLRGLLDRGEVAGVTDLAVRLGVSQPRVTQIVNLTYLAPSIQAEIVGLEAVDGVEPLAERPLRLVLREVGWNAQVKRWCKLLALRQQVGVAQSSTSSSKESIRRAHAPRTTRPNISND